jgi:hypothetical protein
MRGLAIIMTVLFLVASTLVLGAALRSEPVKTVQPSAAITPSG